MANCTLNFILDHIPFSSNDNEREQIINEVMRLNTELHHYIKCITVAKRQLHDVIAEKNAYCEKLIAGVKKDCLPMYSGVCHSLPAYLNDIVRRKEYIAGCQQQSKQLRAAIRLIVLNLKKRMSNTGDIVGLPEVSKEEEHVYVKFSRAQAFKILNSLANGIKAKPDFTSVTLDFPKSAIVKM